MRFFAFSLFLSLWCLTSLYSQTGPAGIGTGDGSTGPRNVLWLKADAGVTQSAGRVSAWADQSGNGLNAMQANGSLQPLYTASNANINNQASINFGPSGTTNFHLAIPHSALLDGSPGMTFFIALRTAGTGTQGILNKRTGAGANQSYRFYRNGGNVISDISDGASITLATASSSNHILSAVYDHTLTGNRYFLYRNSLSSGGATVTTTLPNNNSPLYIGNFNLGDNRSFPGDIAEIIVYRSALTTPQKIVIENLLAQKYGINLGANDIFGNLATYNASYFSDYRAMGTTDGTIKETSASSDALTVSEANGSLGAGEFLALAHDGTAHSSGVVTEIYGDVDSRWGRSWYLEVSQSGVVDGGAIHAELEFDFGTAGLAYSGNLSDYVVLYRDNPAENFSRLFADSYSLEEGDKIVVSVPASRLKSGYYTLGEGQQLVAKTWYIFQDGDWSDPGSWTLDASTAPIYNNPGGDVPGPEDDVIIRSGRTVTVQPTTNNIIINSINVRGNLLLTSSTGHDFKTINGNGQIVLEGNGGFENFPAGTTNGNIGFSDPDNGGTLTIGGAVDVTLNLARTYKNLIIERSADTEKVILAANYTLTGDLTVRNGNLQFGDGTAIARSLSVGGDVLVEDNSSTRIGSISTAMGDVSHSFTISGDLTNEGKVYFTNRSEFSSTADRYNPAHAYYTTADVTGLVNVFFNGSNGDQTVYCNDLTYFSRIVIEKGNDDTYTLSVQAPDSANFRLLGRANFDINNDVTTPASNLNAFSLIKGTVKLGVNVILPVLNATGNYTIPSAARLLIDGGYIRKTAGTAIVPYGTVEITSGTLISSVGSGITIRDSGKLKIDGGNVRLAVLRTSINGATAQGTYEQNGGNVLITGGAAVSADYALFSLTYAGNVFIMTGGTLTINGRDDLGTDDLRGNLFINSDPGNQLVNGGTVVLESNTTTEYRLTSRAPFYNLRIRAANGTAGNVILTGSTSGSGGGIDEPALPAQPLVVLNDLIVHGYSDNFYNNPAGNFSIIFAPVTSGTNVNDVYIGGSFYVGRNSTYQAVFGGVAPYDAVGNLPTHYNTTWFNQTIGTSVSDTVYNGATGGAVQLELGTLVLDRTSGNELRLVSRTGATGGNRLDVNGNISVLSGTMDQNAYSLRIWGSITNYDRLGTYYRSGSYPTGSGTPSEALIIFREDPPVSISTSDDAVFGNLRFNVGASVTVEFDSDVYIERMEYRNGRIYIKNHTLTVDEIWNINNGGGAYFNSDVANSSIIRVNNTGITGNILVFTDGKPSDGGLRLKISGNTLDEDANSRINNTGPLSFPVGFTPDGGATFISRPAQLKVKDFVDDGYVKINVVTGELQLTDLAGGEMLQHYWRVQHSDFSTLPTVALRFYYRAESPVVAGRDRANVEPAGQEENYVPGFVLDDSPYTRNLDAGTGDIVASSYQTGNENAGTRLIVFNGASSGAEFSQAGFAGFTLVNGNFTAGVAARFAGSPTVYYTKGRDLTGTQPRWETANTWTRSDQPGFDSTNPHLSSNPDSPDTPGPGDIAVIGFFPFDDPKTAYRGYPHSARIETGDLQAARLIFQQMTDVDGNAPVPRKYLTDIGGVNAFQFRPTLTWSSVGIIDANTIEGEGTIRIRGFGADERRDPDFSSVDLGEFSSQDSSYLLYEGYETYTINNIPNELPNLVISTDGWGVNDREITIDQNFTTNQNLEIQGNANLILGAANGDATIRGNLYLVPLATNVGGGELRFQNAGTSRSVVVEGNVYVGNSYGAPATGGSVIRVAAGGAVNHTLTVGGDMVVNTTGSNTTIAPNGNGLIFGGAAESNIHLTLNGDEDAALSTLSGNAAQLFRISLDKIAGTDSGFSFDSNFTLSGTTNTAEKAIEIVNGLLTLNDPAIDVTLTSGGGNFLIPNTLNSEASSGSGGLQLAQGTARVSGADTGILLDGLLLISGGTLNMDGGTGVNNFIEYSASGNAEIELTAGTLTVGSQVRRSTTSTSGILKYRQSGGVAVIGKNAAPTTSRGVFEVLNTWSEFTLDIDGGAGESFTIGRHNNSPTVASFRLSPTTSSISETSTIALGNGDTPASQTNFGIYSSIALETLEINSGNITAKIYTAPLTVANLQITTGGTFSANGLNLTINENLSNDGTFMSAGSSANSQTTIFPSEGAGAISGSGSTTFWNFVKSGAGTLSLGKSVTVSNNTTISAGTLNTGQYAFNLKKDLLHDGVHSSDASGPGIIFNGTSSQSLTRSTAGLSYFGVLNINNASGVVITGSEESFQVDGKLVLTTGVLDIGANLLVIPVNSTIENGSGGSAKDDFNVNRMIQTNSSIVDFGVRKFFPATTAGSISFTYPLGLTSYTPAVINITDISASSITLRPVADTPPIAEDTEFTFDGLTGCEDPEIIDSNNVLSYYWIIKSADVAGLNGSIDMYYAALDVNVTAPYTVANYGPARLYNLGSVWDKVFTTNEFDEDEAIVSFSFTGNSDGTLEGIYTAGVTLDDDGTSLLCGAAIPDQVPQFVTLEQASTGNFYDDAAYEGGIAPETGSSSDIVVKSGFTLILDISSVRTRKITIEPGGILEIADGTSNHNLGFVTGEGRLKLVSDGSSISFPTGDYESFFPDGDCIGGGALEYAGSGSYSVLSDLPKVRHLVFSGSGVRTLPNNHGLQVCADFEILESVSLVIPDGNNNTRVRGNIYKSDAASFDNGGGTSSITLGGTTAQVIAGAFAGANAFNGLEIDNANGVTFVNGADAVRGIAAGGDVDVAGALVFSNGLVTTNGANQLRLTLNGTISGYSSSRFVNGPFVRELPPNTQAYPFPIGKGARSGLVAIDNPSGYVGTKDWTAEYFSNTAGAVGPVDAVDAGDEMVKVSENEYWYVEVASPATSNVTLYWDAQSNVESTISNLRLANWTGTLWDEVPITSAPAGSPSGGSMTAGPLSYSTQYITFGTIEEDQTPLPVTYLHFSGAMSNYGVDLDWATASETNNNFFEVQRSFDGVDFETIGVVKGSGTTTERCNYGFVDDKPFAGSSHYRLRQVDYDGNATISRLIAVRTPLEPILMRVYPNPLEEELRIAVNGLDGRAPVDFHLLDLQGGIVMSSTGEADIRGAFQSSLEIPHDIASGLYILVFTANGHTLRQTLIKK